MAFKQLTRDKAKYWINLDQVAYIRQHEDGSSLIQFAAIADHSSLSMQVDQSPDEIFHQTQTRGFNRCLEAVHSLTGYSKATDRSSPTS
jgi:hypothetical protein